MNKHKKRYRHVRQKSAKYTSGCFMKNRLTVLLKILKYNEFEDKDVAKFLISSYANMYSMYDIERQIRRHKPPLDWEELVSDVEALCMKHGVFFEAQYNLPFERYANEQHVLFCTYITDLPNPYGDKTLIRRYLKKPKLLGGLNCRRIK